MSQAFVSSIGLFQQDIFGSYGKVASIFFDRLILQEPSADFLEGVLNRLVEQNQVKPLIADYLRKIWVPIQLVLPGSGFLENPWQHRDQRLTEVALSVTLDTTREQYPGADENHPGFLHEISLAGGGLIGAVAMWGALNAREACAFLAGDRESRVVQQIFQKTQPPEASDVFREVLESRIPDLSALTWERVLDLRSHAFLEDFRRKITELASALRSSSERTISEGVREIELHDLRELARLVKPSPRKTILKSMASNLPLPIPINPASIGIAIQEIVEAYERRKRFGWLYFLMDLSS